ncbi:hypothetical protein ACP4OV_014747 [Aristida adscensionis]
MWASVFAGIVIPTPPRSSPPLRLPPPPSPPLPLPSRCSPPRLPPSCPSPLRIRLPLLSPSLLCKSSPSRPPPSPRLRSRSSARAPPCGCLPLIHLLQGGAPWPPGQGSTAAGQSSMATRAGRHGHQSQFHRDRLLKWQPPWQLPLRFFTFCRELNGHDFDWLNSPVDVRALYECSCGRPHGKWAIFNGIVDHSEALAELKSSRTNSSIAAKRKRQEEDGRVQMEAHDCRVAKEYAQNMLEWGRVMQGHNATMHSFLQNMAAHMGMPSVAIPPPPPPPPPPPTYGVSASPNPSPNNVDTFGSNIGGESPEETLQRIANGQFGGRVIGTASGGGTYSPPLHDDFNPFD